MATTKLRQRPDKKKRIGKLGIYVQVCIDQKVKLYSTGQSVEKEFWDDKNQRVKRIPGTNSHTKINLILEKKHQEIKDIIFRKTINGESVSFESITQVLNAEEIILTKFTVLFERFFQSKTKEFGRGTTKNYAVLKNQILEYRKGRDFEIGIIDFAFYDGLKNWLIDKKGQKNSTVNKRLKTFKTFLRYCSDYGLYNGSQLDKFKTLESKPSTKIVLTEEEFQKIWACDFSENDRLDKVRDLFIFSCCTGLRESDVQNLRRANIRDSHIYFNAIKTSSILEIPLNKYSQAILEKYDYQLPKISQQKLNGYLKEIGLLAGIDGEEIDISFQGGKRYERVVKRYKLLSSHVGRRSFVTLSILKGVPIPVIQSMTGHKDLASFQKYIKIDKSAKEKAMERW